LIRYYKDEKILERARKVIKDKSLDHIDPDRIVCFSSKGSKSRRVIARCWSLPVIWQKALEVRPHYVIEVISERFEKLDEQSKDNVILHELLHIPKGFGGGLRHHKQLKRALGRIIT
jgi:predicted metallopeptidase